MGIKKGMIYGTVWHTAILLGYGSGNSRGSLYSVPHHNTRRCEKEGEKEWSKQSPARMPGKRKGVGRSVGRKRPSGFVVGHRGAMSEIAVGERRSAGGEFAFLPFEVGHSQVIESSWKREFPCGSEKKI